MATVYNDGEKDLGTVPECPQQLGLGPYQSQETTLQAGSSMWAARTHRYTLTIPAAFQNPHEQEAATGTETQVL